jgi:protein associated with RNAse G/E
MIIAQIIVDLTLNNNYANKSITHYSHDITEILLKVLHSLQMITIKQHGHISNDILNLEIQSISLLKIFLRN